MKRVHCEKCGRLIAKIKEQKVICPKCGKENIIGKTIATASDDATYFWCEHCEYREGVDGNASP